MTETLTASPEDYTLEERVTALEGSRDNLALIMMAMAEQLQALAEALPDEGESDDEPEVSEASEQPALNQLRDEAFNNAMLKGFHDRTPEVSMQGWLADDAMKLALIHAEVSEALEALRDDYLPDDHLYLDEDGDLVYDESVNEDGDLRKPEGVPAELADVIIRVLDYCGSRDIDIARAVREKMAYNATRPAMHGKKF